MNEGSQPHTTADTACCSALLKAADAQERMPLRAYETVTSTLAIKWTCTDDSSGVSTGHVESCARSLKGL